MAISPIGIARGEFFSYRFEFDKDKRNVRGVMMYDAEYLYIGAHIGDSTPMVNSMNPETDAKSAWRGDCLQVRLTTDPKLGYPVKGNIRSKEGTSGSDNIVHLTIWYFTPKKQPWLCSRRCETARQ